MIQKDEQGSEPEGVKMQNRRKTQSKGERMLRRRKLTCRRENKRIYNTISGKKSKISQKE